MIKVLLERKVPKDKYSKLIGLLNDLRAESLHQPGYVSGETLVKGEDPIEVLVISTWISEDHWKAWTTNEQCIELDQMIDSFLGAPTRFTVYKAPYPIAPVVDMAKQTV